MKNIDHFSHIVMLEEIHYPPYTTRREPWHTISTPFPSMAQIEAGIRRLDRDEWPFVHMHTNKPIDGEPPENSLTVMGGRGEYCVFLTPAQEGETFQSELFLTDASRSQSIVRIWESDQGFEIEERYLCSDIDKVLLIARYFTDHETLYPDAVWEWRN